MEDTVSLPEGVPPGRQRPASTELVLASDISECHRMWSAGEAKGPSEAFVPLRSPHWGWSLNKVRGCYDSSGGSLGG